MRFVPFLLIWGLLAARSGARADSVFSWIQNFVSHEDPCEQIRRQAGMDEDQWKQSGLCVAASSVELRAARGGCAYMDGERSLTDPSCLQTARETLIRRASQQYLEAWGLIPTEARAAFWRSCKSSSSRWDLLFTCLSNAVRSVSNSSSVNFAALAQTSKSILINGMEEVKARTQLCDDTLPSRVAPGVLRDAVNRVRAGINFPGCDLSLGEQAQQISRGLNQELSNTLDWMGCESAPPTPSRSGCNFASMPYQPEGCQTQDLNESPSSPLRRIPVYDQDGSGTCYAHAASVLLNTEILRSGRPDSEMVNPIFAAWQENYEHVLFIRRPDTGGGFEDNVINGVARLGYCPAAKVEESLRELKSEAGFTDAQLLHFLELMYDYFKNPSGTDEEWSTALRETAAKLNPDVCIVPRLQPLADTLRLRGLSGIAATEILNNLFKSCSGPARIYPQIGPMETFGEGPDAAMREKIDLALAADRPTAIALCAETLQDPSVTRSITVEHPDPPWVRGNYVRSPCGAHAVTLTGRRMIGGACQYLVRNSWGAWWHPQGRSCACILWSGQYQPVCTDEGQAKEYVGCWYKAVDLMPNIISVTRIKRDPD